MIRHPRSSSPPGTTALRSGPHRRRSVSAGAASAAAALAAGLALWAVAPQADAGTLGAGSYTETLPAGGALPSGCPGLSTNPRQYVSANAPAGAVPTNDWWSSLLFKRWDCAFSEPLHAHPLSFDTFPGGLGLSYSTEPQISGTSTGVGEYHFPYTQDLLVGVAGLAAPRVTVDGWTDWTGTPLWNDGSRTLRATIGHGLAFAYFQVTGGDARLTTSGTLRVWNQSGSRIGFTAGGHDYVAFAPTGATWSATGTSITSNLAGRGYFSVAVLPTTAASSDTERSALASSFAAYAHAHVTGTTMSYAYDQSTSRLTTTYALTTTAREGTASGTMVALYPHQWRSLTGNTPVPQTYTSPRGPMRVLQGVSNFQTSMVFRGVLPEVPAVATSAGADLATATAYLNAEIGDPMRIQNADTYWTGKGLGRAARIAEIADQLGLAAVRDSALAAIRTSLNNWFTASAGETGQLFYYNADWGTVIGYPASYGLDQELNDHHFHYGYFVAAAAALAKHDPQWAAPSAYGGMVDLLIRDANNYDRTDSRFPYLRDFDIYAGHDWASGHGAFGAGNNQESSSEGMNFANALIQWGIVTGNTAVRDAGIYLYTTQAAAISEYWFDVRDANFPPAFGHGVVGMVWGDGGAYATWFSAEPEMIQGINLLPITGGHLYLGDTPAYVLSNYAELVTNNGGPPTVWQDILWEYLALADGPQALSQFQANPSYPVEEGESRAHTYHWIRNLAALGTVDNSVTADHPLARAFVSNGARTYVAANLTASAITVTFSNGVALNVPPGQTVTSGAFDWSGGSGGGVPQPTVSPSGPPSPTPTFPPTPFDPVRYLQPSGALAPSPTGAGTVNVVSAGGANHDGAPTNARVFTATGLTATYAGSSTSFDLFVDAGGAVGNGVQARVSYDLTGDGSWDRVETYRYFATDPVAGYEHYTAAAGTLSVSGSLGNLAGGAVRVEIWNAIGNGATTLGGGDRSTVVLPFAGATSPPPTGGPAGPDRYLASGGGLTTTQGNPGTVTIAAAGTNHIGTPHNPVVFTATAVNGNYTGATTSFDLFLDSASSVGNGVQMRISYDRTGDGSWDRVETYHYFATDPVSGYERYTETAGLSSTSGVLGNMTGGTVRVELWSAIGPGPSTLAIGNQSVIHLPIA